MRKLVGIKLVDEFDLYDIEVEDDHCFELVNGVIAHNSMYPKDIVSGGTGIYLSADNIYILGRQQEKEGTEVVGYNFIINIEKSRHAREKSKIPITVKHDGGLSKWSGLLDIALEGKFVVKPSNGWYSRVTEDGEVEDKKYRMKDTDNREFWEPILLNKQFRDYVRDTYKGSNGTLISSDDGECSTCVVDEDEDSV